VAADWIDGGGGELNMSRYHRATDSTHAPILRTLRELGYTVYDTHALGDDFPDAVAGANGVTILVECIGADDRPHTIREHKARAEGWKGGPWLVVRNLAELLAQLGVSVQ
jgi:Holliday junction resolvase